MSSYLIVIIWESVFYIIHENDDDDDDFYDYTLPWLHFFLTSRLLSALQFEEKLFIVLYCWWMFVIMKRRDIKGWQKFHDRKSEAIAKDLIEIDSMDENNTWENNFSLSDALGLYLYTIWGTIKALLWILLFDLLTATLSWSIKGRSLMTTIKNWFFNPHPHKAPRLKCNIALLKCRD